MDAHSLLQLRTPIDKLIRTLAGHLCSSLYCLPATSSTLRRLDDEMYKDFQATFPEFAESAGPKSVAKIDEEAMKSPAGKEKWRLFINKYENKGKFLSIRF